jgi:hypothetical protein
MKNQYFGDINDYYKYGLLRMISSNTNLKIGICWMLTAHDNRRDGSKTGYLSQAETWRKYDPVLFDFLKHRVAEYKSRDVTEIEDKLVLPGCVFNSEILDDNLEVRCRYFSNFRNLFHDCDLLFFDTDNGMEVKSRPCGRKDSSKYLYWHEASELYNLGYSLLVFQYHRRMRYGDFSAILSSQFEANVGTRPTVFYRTSYVSLILVAQYKHRSMFRKVNQAVSAKWAGKIQIIYT